MKRIRFQFTVLLSFGLLIISCQNTSTNSVDKPELARLKMLDRADSLELDGHSL